MGGTQCAERVHLNSLLWFVSVSLTPTAVSYMRGLVGVKDPPPLRLFEKPGIEGGTAGSRTAISAF
jgi:hypothetical protein